MFLHGLSRSTERLFSMEPEHMDVPLNNPYQRVEERRPIRFPSRPFAAPIRQQKVSARRNVPARTIASDTNDPLDLPLLPIESSPSSQYPLPQQQAQETLGESNLRRSRKLKDRLISQQLMGEYDRHLGDGCGR